MRRRALPVEQARGREHERAGAHRRDPPAPAGELRHRPHEPRVAGGRERALAADDDERVDRGPGPTASERSATIPGPRTVTTGPASGAATTEVVPARRGEHLVRPDQVERGDPGVDDEDDVGGSWAPLCGSAGLAAMTFSGRFLPYRGPGVGRPSARCYKVR